MSVITGRTSLAAETPTVKVGDPAPDFTLSSHTGEEFHLAVIVQNLKTLANYVWPPPDKQAAASVI